MGGYQRMQVVKTPTSNTKHSRRFLIGGYSTSNGTSVCQTTNLNACLPATSIRNTQQHPADSPVSGYPNELHSTVCIVCLD